MLSEFIRWFMIGGKNYVDTECGDANDMPFFIRWTLNPIQYNIYVILFVEISSA